MKPMATNTMASDAPFKGGNPRARNDAEVMNELYRFWRGRQRVEGLTWLLGNREFYALMNVEPGTTGVSVDPKTGKFWLFGVPVVRVISDSERRLVVDAAWEAR